MLPASPKARWAPPSPGEAMNQFAAAHPPSPEAAHRATIAPQKREAPLRPAGRRGRGRGWRAFARRRSLGRFLLLRGAGHLGEFIGKTLAKVLPGAIDV